ncbi:alternative ribosome rescue aminoacyl-tRNA hydrolase ArfB [Thalassospira sp. MCCC 1A01428]|uniref:alternative ribosome rescue aminoacyl-tRNA hydrolase ArfB n=1 Tax=Thalassospira sp. MCCC 1A01428 TaxID=1470575 RepID=UPI000A1F800A|nr:alternative ribosome rescue aminoacyl-tRNA hydrolase ArfB [Thalassospira sp. MCCC 1A01428]OSQ46424.1 peptide chain release factor I [Thalassospira sp. MCCC 1A01428]
MIDIGSGLYFDERHLEFQFIRSSGPGGQNVNKVASAVQMRVRIDDLHELPLRVRDRLKEIGGNRVTTQNELIIEAQRFRTQERNKQDAIERLVAMLRKATERKKYRVKTRPTLASKRRRIDTKKKRGDTKKMRKSPTD